MKTILQVCEAFEGGQFYFVSQICNALAGDFRFVLLYGPHRKGTPQKFADFFPAGTEFIAWSSAQRELKPRQDMTALKELKEVVARVKPDLVHAHSSKAGALVRWALRGGEVPTLYTPNGYAHLRKDISGLKRAVFRSLERLLGYTPHITLAAGEAEFREALSLVRKAYFISNTVPLAPAFYPDGTASAPLRVVMSGRIVPQKNFPLFRAIATAAEGLNIDFTWVGGAEDGTVPQLPSNARITGWVSRHEAMRHVAEADIYLQTALWEGLPLTVLEAMTCGKPILATNIGPNRELVLQGTNGHICDTAEEFVARMREFLADRSALTRMGQASRRIIECRYDMDYAMASWRAVYGHYASYFRGV